MLSYFIRMIQYISVCTGQTLSHSDHTRMNLASSTDATQTSTYLYGLVLSGRARPAQDRAARSISTVPASKPH